MGPKFRVGPQTICLLRVQYSYVNVISLFYESEKYRGLCWHGPVLFIILGLDTAVWPHQQAKAVVHAAAYDVTFRHG